MSKATREKRVEQEEYLNPIGTLHGGILMKWLDEAGGDAAHCHCEKFCVTVHVDSFEFLRPVLLGELLVMKAAVNRTWNSSLEVGICAEVKDERTDKRHLVASAYFVYVAIDKDRRPIKVAAFVPRTDEEKSRWHDAGRRRNRRLHDKKRQEKKRTEK